MKTKNKIMVFIAILILIGAVLICFAYFNKPSYLKSNLPFEKNDGKLLGIVQIGGLEEDYKYSLVDKYFKTKEFETINLDGTEKYLIIPRDCEVQVYSLAMGKVDDDILMNETYIKTMTEPFYITCNVSDIIANSLLKVVKDGKQYSYSPYISLKDGSLVVEDFVLNIE